VRRGLPVAVVILAMLVLAWFLSTVREPVRENGDGETSLAVAQALSAGDTEGYARANAPRAFAFPADHGPHPAFKHEWWYFTGNLRAADGRRFGYQLTFFRIALRPRPAARASAWATEQVYMAHFTVTDVEGQRFHQTERVTRAALGLAGASAQPFCVWLEDWSAQGTMHAGRLHTRLQAREDAYAIDLALESIKAPVLQGEAGLSQKSAAPGNASYYYSLTRLATQGHIRIGSQQYAVDGLSWMDREWSTSALGRDQRGWDWFSLQLSDGSDLMFYRLHRRDGTSDPFSAGLLVDRAGRTRRLRLDDVELDVSEHWRSPAGGVYPGAWRLRIPSVALDVTILPALPDQELHGIVRYWEGAVTVRGDVHGSPVTGSGYVELTGYADRPNREPS
jgi:predicted secreted hydrolase